MSISEFFHNAAIVIAKHIKIIALVGGCLCVALPIVYLIHEKEDANAKLEASLIKSQKDKDQAIANFNVAQQVDTNDQATIAQLVKDKSAVDTANAALGKQLQSANLFNKQLNAKILSAPASADGPVAPVLRDTINTIQKDRMDRQP